MVPVRAKLEGSGLAGRKLKRLGTVPQKLALCKQHPGSSFCLEPSSDENHNPLMDELQLSYRPLSRLENRRRIATLAGILGNKGLKTDSPECRWCGKAPENLAHITNECQTWKKKIKDGAGGLRQPDKETNIAEILEWAGQE
ncbi:hypothetical protein BDZ91DRAFT_801074 [Kalaharituber pfeilii]|nr:hypothetical protein BDZ91DRAFT_801074 [Kalaharituber pfeilii]